MYISIFDIVNAVFVFGASLLKLRDINHVLKDKKVNGVSRWPRLYAGVWAVYSIWLFVYLEFYFAAAAFMCLAVVEFTYFYLLNKYKYDI